MPAGAPRIYDTNNPEDLIKVSNLCDEYFESIAPDDKNPLGEPPTVNGLTLFLGFCDKSTLYDYRNRKDELSHPIKKALTKIELSHEKGLYSKHPTGHIFALKNSGWVDKIEQDITSKGEKIGAEAAGIKIGFVDENGNIKIKAK